MNLPITQASPVDIAGSTLYGVFNGIGSTMQGGLLQAIALAGGGADYTAQEFWDAQGTNGAAVLNVFSSLANVLGSIYPDLMTPEIAHAGDKLVVHPDGTVTVKS